MSGGDYDGELMFHNASNLKEIGMIPKMFNTGLPSNNN